MKYTYLLIDCLTLVFPLAFSFHVKSNFYKLWNTFFPAVFITGFLFILWDTYFTYKGVWGFNSSYTTGFKIGNLPIEEILFFFCIPYACIFTFCLVYSQVKFIISESSERYLSIGLILIYGAIAVFNFSKYYTFSAFAVLALLHLAAIFLLKIKWLFKFYIIYALLLFPFFIVNGLLTGTLLAAPVVWYNDNEIIGTRILTIPVEDIFYGMALIFLNLLIFKGLQKKYA